ncbi:AAA family ATPase [Chryseobacterium oranimense]|uniref:AAA family ATPase n=1 Tax=Chryseobacterium oranimense TaxID=421058 RepID=UPI002235E8DC|nr:AAA family ATPase [Chryseobacterium oranimense]
MRYDLLLNEMREDKIINRYILSEEKKIMQYLSNIKRINIFVGANNSGKSWMMRYLMGKDDYNYLRLDELTEKITSFNKLLKKDINTRQRQDQWMSSTTAPNINIHLLINFSLDDIRTMSSQNRINLSTLINYDHWELFDTYLDRNNISQLVSINDEIIEILNENKSIKKKKDKEEFKYYIPTLRTAHSLYDIKDNVFIKIEDDIFLNTLKQNYGVTDVKIFTGLHLYKAILNSRNARKEIRKRFDDFETFVQKNFFSGKKIDIVAEFDKDKSLSGDNSGEIISIHIDGENDTRKLHELGDGIQAIIILMYQIFMAEDDSVIFIDEPELNLHPGMQRLFFEQISLNNDITEKKLTYFISTHSNHLLDLTLENDDVSIYSFNPIIENGNKKIIVKNVNFGNNELLRDLGVNNTSVFLANSSIWVEGISDRNYIKAFLRAYCDDNTNRNYPKEDIDFAFFEYAGGNIEHYIFNDEINEEDEVRFLNEINTLALSNKIFLLADSDMAKVETKKYNRLKSLEENFSKNDNLDGQIFWTIRESENLLSKNVWKKVLIEFCNKNKIVKSTQEQIDNYFEKEEELNKTEYVGRFLKKVKEAGIPLNEICKKIPRGSGEEWQTFKDKAGLSRVILEKTLNGFLTWDDFKEVPEVITLTEKIYQFIKKRVKNLQINEID